VPGAPGRKVKDRHVAQRHHFDARCSHEYRLPVLDLLRTRPFAIRSVSHQTNTAISYVCCGLFAGAMAVLFLTICDVLIDEHRPEDRRNIMDYVCGQCGMGVTGLTCVKCGQELVHDHITTDDGTTVAVSKCPNDCGMIKSPSCCGVDMTCST